MSGISPSVFLTRDVLEHVFPVALAAVLFAPFLAPPAGVDLELLIVATVLLAYPLSSFLQLVCEQPWVGETMAWLYRQQSREHGRSSPAEETAESPEKQDCPTVGPPAVPGDLPPASDARSIAERFDWQRSNWDFDAVFNQLGKEEREYFYLTRAYLRLFQVAALLTLFSALVHTVYWGAQAYAERSVVGSPWSELVWLGSPLIRGEAPSLILAFVSLVLFTGLYGWYLAELRSLFFDWGSYVQTARRLHRQHGGLAVGIWGRLVPVEEAVDACVELLRDDELFARAAAGEGGWFQLPRTLAPCLGRRCRLRIRLADGRIAERDLALAEKDIPELVIDLDRSAEPPGRPAPRGWSLFDCLALLLRFFCRRLRS